LALTVDEFHSATDFVAAFRERKRGRKTLAFRGQAVDKPLLPRAFRSGERFRGPEGWMTVEEYMSFMRPISPDRDLDETHARIDLEI
jgi:hypothetical protein